RCRLVSFLPQHTAAMPLPPRNDAPSEKLFEMQQQLLQQREQIQALKEQIASMVATTEHHAELNANENDKDPEKEKEEHNDMDGHNTEALEEQAKNIKQRRRQTIYEEKIHVAFYEFQQSMWDAALLLCFHHTSVIDKILLFIGVSSNLILQMSLLLVISQNMLENPYPDSKVQEMVRWRVLTGHTIFDEDQGKSQISRLCNRELWSYEQDQYDEMYEYLYKPMPGIILSTLAIILWVLTIMVEYRHCLEQAQAVINLPRLDEKDEFSEVSDHGRIEIKGIQPCLRWVALCLLCLPRLFVMGFLAVIGCQYLAQTPSLSDIVLNAVALAFVLDVDELLANVLLTEKLRGLLPKIEPLTCGTTTRRDTPMRDLMRYLITAGVIGFSCYYWLLPFSRNVEAAAMALCGGYQDFSYEGGTQVSNSVVLKPASYGTDLFVADCDPASEATYLSKYYIAGINRSQTQSIQKMSIDQLDKMKKKEVMDFALNTFFSGCGSGRMLGPQPENGDRTCMNVPESLTRNLPAEVKPGESSLPPNCPRFNSSLGCQAVTLPNTCVWSWLSAKCDGISPPGQMQTSACESEYPVMCQTWDQFGKQHPTMNCAAWSRCPEGQYECMRVETSLDFTMNDISLADPNIFPTVVARAIINITGGVLDELNIYANFNELWNAQSVRRLSTPTTHLSGTVSITLLPANFFPNILPDNNASLVSATMFEYLKEQNTSTLEVTAATFPDFKFMTDEEYMQSTNPGSGDDGDDGGYGGDDGDVGGYGGDDGDDGIGDDGDDGDDGDYGGGDDGGYGAL
ncbi:unnamed protein product, partial [Effrenium voratum]